MGTQIALGTDRANVLRAAEDFSDACSHNVSTIIERLLSWGLGIALIFWGLTFQGQFSVLNTIFGQICAILTESKVTDKCVLLGVNRPPKKRGALETLF